jgi:hypothetical protein
MTVQPFSATAQIKSLAGSATAPGVTFVGDGDTGLYSPGTNQVGIATGGTQRLLIGSDGTISLGSNLGVPLATAASPSVFFGTDTNTGIYSPGADQVAISTNGTGRLFVDASGNVGVGTGSPVSKLDIGGSTSGQTITFSNTADNTGTRLAGALSYRTGSAYTGKILEVHTGTFDDIYDLRFFAANGGASSERMRLTSAGLLGLGTSSPSSSNGGLDIASGGLSLVVGANNNSSSRTNASVKTSRICSYHYTNAEEPVAIAVADSTATNNFIYFGGNTSLCNSATQIQFYTAANTTTTTGTQRMVIDSSGNVGIGTTSPAFGAITGKSLEIEDTSAIPGIRIDGGASGGSLEIYATGENGVIDNRDNGGGLVFRQVGAETARIDSSGRLLVGTSSDITGASAYLLQVVNTSFAQFALGRSDGTTSGDTRVGRIAFYSNAGSVNEPIALIDGVQDGTSGSGDKPGRLVFSTTADGAASPTERLRINSSGQIAVAGAGSAAAPVITKGNDLNTGIFFPAADTIAFAEGGSEAARIDSSGRLLVGTSSASGNALLQVNGASRQAGVYSTAASRTWDMAGATDLFDISFGNQGNFTAEFTWILQDTAASNFGTRIGKLYIAAHGSGVAGPTAATVAAEDKTSSAGGTLPTITWAVSVTGGKVRLTGTPSSDSGDATIYLWGSSPLLSEITAL